MVDTGGCVMKVFVYFNLHRKLWSIKAMEGENKGKVIGHASMVQLSDVKFKVSESGRQRVLREKKKNVHAGACGYIQYAELIDGECIGYPHGRSDSDTKVLVTYNPYKYSSFVDMQNFEPVHSAAFVDMKWRRVLAYM